MSIQQAIDAVLKNPDLTLGNITVNGESGSFELEEGVRLLVRNAGSATCTSNGGRNELQFVDCGSASVEGFHDGILRFERCGSISISTSGNVQVHLSASTAQVQMVNSRLVAVECSLGGSAKDSEVSTFNCNGSLSVDGGQFQSDSDTLNLNIKNAIAVLSKTNMGGAQFEDSSVTAQNCSGSAVQVRGGQFLDQDGQYGGAIDVSGIAKLIRTKTGGTLSVAGAATVENGTIGGAIVASSASVSAISTSAKALTINECSGLVLVDCKFGGDGSISKTPARLVSCDFNSTSIKESSIESNGCKFGSYSHSGGNIQSAGDKFGNLSGSELRGPNLIYNPDGVKDCSLSGSGSNIDVRGMKCSKLSIDGFASAELSGVEFSSISASGMKDVSLQGCSGDSGEFSSISNLRIEDTDISGDVSFDGIHMLLIDSQGDEVPSGFGSDLDNLNLGVDDIGGPGGGGTGAGGSGIGKGVDPGTGPGDLPPLMPTTPDAKGILGFDPLNIPNQDPGTPISKENKDLKNQINNDKYSSDTIQKLANYMDKHNFTVPDGLTSEQADSFRREQYAKNPYAVEIRNPSKPVGFSPTVEKSTQYTPEMQAYLNSTAYQATRNPVAPLGPELPKGDFGIGDAVRGSDPD